MPCATYRLPRSFAGRFRRQRRGLLLLPALPAGRGKFLRRASPSWAGAPVGCLPGGLAVGADVVVQRAAISRASARFSSTQSRSQPRQHRQQPLRSLLQKEKHPGNPVQTRCRRCRAAPGVAGGSRVVRCSAAVPAGTDSSATPLPLSPIPVSGRLRAKSIRLQSETKHCGVFRDLLATGMHFQLAAV